MNSRGLEGQCSVCSNSLKTNMKIKLIPQLHVATRQQALILRLRHPWSKGHPPLQSCWRCPGTPQAVDTRQTEVTAIIRVAFALPHQEDTFLTALKIHFCMQRMSKREGYSTKLKPNQGVLEKPDLPVLLMSTWITSARYSFCPSAS